MSGRRRNPVRWTATRVSYWLLSRAKRKSETKWTRFSKVVTRWWCAGIWSSSRRPASHRRSRRRRSPDCPGRPESTTWRTRPTRRSRPALAPMSGTRGKSDSINDVIPFFQLRNRVMVKNCHYSCNRNGGLNQNSIFYSNRKVWTKSCWDHRSGWSQWCPIK